MDRNEAERNAKRAYHLEQKVEAGTLSRAEEKQAQTLAWRLRDLLWKNGWYAPEGSTDVERVKGASKESTFIVPL
jgi:hypothetical protein